MLLLGRLGAGLAQGLAPPMRGSPTALTEARPDNASTACGQLPFALCATAGGTVCVWIMRSVFPAVNAEALGLAGSHEGSGPHQSII